MENGLKETKWINYKGASFVSYTNLIYISDCGTGKGLLGLNDIELLEK